MQPQGQEILLFTHQGGEASGTGTSAGRGWENFPWNTT